MRFPFIFMGHVCLYGECAPTLADDIVNHTFCGCLLIQKVYADSEAALRSESGGCSAKSAATACDDCNAVRAILA